MAWGRVRSKRKSRLEVAKVSIPNDGREKHHGSVASCERAAPTLASIGFMGAPLKALQGEFNQFSQRQMLKVLELVLDRMQQLIKDALDDADMPLFVKTRIVDRAVDKFWPRVRKELIWEYMLVVDGARDIENIAYEEQRGPDRFRAFFRYRLQPYDKRLFGRLRDPVWLLAKFLMLCPVGGMPAIMYSFVFVTIDKSDSYQLARFILDLKVNAFFSHGLIKCMLGFLLYFRCVSSAALTLQDWDVGTARNTLRFIGFPYVADASGPRGSHECVDRGTGRAILYPIAVAGVLLESVLLCAACLLLPWAQEKGRGRLGHRVSWDQMRSGSSTDGGLGSDRLRYLRLMCKYDMCVFCLSATMLVVTCLARRWSFMSWTTRQTFFACDVVRGLLSFPWLVFKVPGLSYILTASKPSAYDTRGVCRRPHPPRGDRAARHREERRRQAEKLAQDDFQYLSQGEFIAAVRAMKGSEDASQPKGIVSAAHLYNSVRGSLELASPPIAERSSMERHGGEDCVLGLGTTPSNRWRKRRGGMSNFASVAQRNSKQRVSIAKRASREAQGGGHSVQGLATTPSNRWRRRRGRLHNFAALFVRRKKSKRRASATE